LSINAYKFSTMFTTINLNKTTNVTATIIIAPIFNIRILSQIDRFTKKKILFKQIIICDIKY